MFVFLCSLWSMLRSEFCQLASLVVPQLLHALSLSHGADIFWRLVDSSFNSQDWKIRFQAGLTAHRLFSFPKTLCYHGYCSLWD